MENYIFIVMLRRHQINLNLCYKKRQVFYMR